MPFVHATVVRAEQPTSARPGDDAIILADGTMEGFVGGQCAEESVRAAALGALERGESLLLRVLPGGEGSLPRRPWRLRDREPVLVGRRIGDLLGATASARRASASLARHRSPTPWPTSPEPLGFAVARTAARRHAAGRDRDDRLQSRPRRGARDPGRPRRRGRADRRRRKPSPRLRTARRDGPHRRPSALGSALRPASTSAPTPRPRSRCRSSRRSSRRSGSTG